MIVMHNALIANATAAIALKTETQQTILMFWVLVLAIGIEEPGNKIKLLF